jgi:hypothetical protein
VHCPPGDDCPVENVGWFVAAMAVIFLINLSPGFMPSSWMVMAFFYIQFGLPLVPLCVAGALVSGLGRLCLAKGSDWTTQRFFPKKKEDLRSLGGYLERKRGFVAGFVFVYSLLPLPTNNLFLAAGMTRVNLAPVLRGFYAARLPADLFWVWTTNATFRSLDEVFAKSGNVIAIALQAGALLSVALLYFLPWGKWLRRYIDSHGSGDGNARPEAAKAGV